MPNTERNLICNFKTENIYLCYFSLVSRQKKRHVNETKNNLSKMRNKRMYYQKKKIENITNRENLQLTVLIQLPNLKKTKDINTSDSFLFKKIRNLGTDIAGQL